MTDRLNDCTPPTHRAIAKALGVAPSTVSLALRSDPRVQPSTAKRIQQEAEKLGYRPNPSVSMWMAHVRSTRGTLFREAIAYVHTIPKDHSFRKYVPFHLYKKGAEDRASRLGYQLREFEWHAEGMTSQRLRAILNAQGIRGVIFEYSDFEESEQYSIDFDWSGLTAISVVGRPSDLNIHNVSSNYFDGVILAYQKALELGYRRIALALHMFSDQSMDYEISGGFLCAQSLNEALPRIPIHNTQVVQGWDRKGFGDWLKKYKPEVVLSPDGEILEFLKHHGLHVPQDVGFVHLIKPVGSALSGVEHHPELIGSVAVDLLSGLLHLNESGRVQYVRRELLEPSWSEGFSIVQKPAWGKKRKRAGGLPLRVYSRRRDWQSPGQDKDALFQPKNLSSFHSKYITPDE